MLDEVIDRIRALDHDREFRALTEHVAVTSPVALDRTARDNLSSVDREAQRIAAIQLRVVGELGNKLRWLEGVSREILEPQTRAAVMAVVQSLSRPELLSSHASEVVALLEPAILFHALVARLRPWLPPIVLALEPDSVLDTLLLGIPDYLHPLLRERYADLWRVFHRVRGLSSAEIDELGALEHLDDTRLRRVLDGPATGRNPPAPPWTIPVWISPWLRPRSSSSEDSRPECA